MTIFLEAALESLRPLFTFVNDVTFHTATLRWVVGDHNGPITVNGTYEISIMETTDHLNTSKVNTRNASLQINYTHGSQKKVYHSQLLTLDQNTTYLYSISAISNVGTIETAATGTFRTYGYCECELTMLLYVYPQICTLKLF